MVTAQITAEILEASIERRLKRNEKRLQRANHPRALWKPRKNKPGKYELTVGGVIDRVATYVLPPSQPRVPNATIHIQGPDGRRAVIPLLPGDSGKHDPRHARQLSQHLRKARHRQRIPFADPYEHYRLIVTLIRWVSEFGDIHDLTEATEQLCQIFWLAYNGNIDRDKYTPFPDLELSNFDTYDIYYRAFANYIDVEQFQKIRPHIETVFQCSVFIEYAEHVPGIVRVYPIGNVNHLTENPVLPTTGKGLTNLFFGYSTRGKVGEPIERDIRTIFNNTNIMCLGATGTGKTNDIGVKLHYLDLMIKANEIVGTGIFIDGGKRGAGLDMYKKRADEELGIDFATTPEEIESMLLKLHKTYLERVQILASLNRANWPIGEEIDGVKYRGLVVIMDEASVLLKAAWRLQVKNPNAKINDKDKGMTVAELIALWTQEWRAVGMLLVLYVHQARAQEGVSTDITVNCLLKQSFRLEDEKLGPVFFNCSLKQFSLPPTEFKQQGQFVMKTPEGKFYYGKTVRAPHTIEEDKLKAVRGY